MSRRLLVALILTLFASTPILVAAQNASPTPSERLIAFQTSNGVEDSVWLMNEDGSQPIQLASEIDGGHFHPDWSPSADRIVFEVQHGEAGALWTVGVDGSDQTLLFECVAPCIRPESPAWSPDGSQVAFISIEETDGVPGPPDETAIQILDLATTSVREVVRTKFPTLMSVPRWSPNGDMFVVGVEQLEENGDKDLGSGIAVVSANGGELRMLTSPEVFAYYPDWNTNGDTIVFDSQALKWAKDPPTDPETWNIYSISPDGTGLRQITNADNGNKLWQPSWTPDGERIIATMDDPNGRMAVFVDPDSGDVSIINGRLATHARLQPDPG